VVVLAVVMVMGEVMLQEGRAPTAQQPPPHQLLLMVLLLLQMVVQEERPSLFHPLLRLLLLRMWWACHLLDLMMLPALRVRCATRRLVWRTKL